MKIDYNPRAIRFELYPTTAEEFHIFDGKEVTPDEFIAHYNKLLQNSAYGKLATDYIGKDKKCKFIIVHKNIHPSLKVVIPIHEIQSIVERDDGCATIRLKGCNFINYDTAEKYDEIIRQLL